MNVWIVNPYGELPSEGWREYRSSLIARALANRGHNVVWWISDFEHRTKAYRRRGCLSDPLLPSNVKIVSVHSDLYKENISVQRIRYEISFANEFARLAEREMPPDLIILSAPALFTGGPVFRFRDRVGCKLVLDVLDLWPEIFEVAFPKSFRRLAKLFLQPLYFLRRKQIGICDGLVGVSSDYVIDVLRHERKTIPKLIAHLGIDIDSYNSCRKNQALELELLEFRKRYELIVVYAGTLGNAYDIDLIIAAIGEVRRKGLPIGFVVAGNGPRAPDLNNLSKDERNPLKYLGALRASEMKTVYDNCDVGLMSYVAGSTVSMPVKLFDLAAAGLAIVSSLEREARMTISRNQIGLSYRASDLSDFMSKLIGLVKNPELVQSFKFNAKQLSLAYDTKVIYAQYADFLEKAVMRV